MLEREITFDRAIRMLIGLGVVAAIGWLVNYLSGVLLPFAVAALGAYLLFPVVKFFQYRARLHYRWLAITATLIIVLGAVAAVIVFVVPPLITEASHIRDMLGQYLSSNTDYGSIPDFVSRFIADNIDIDKLGEMLSEDNIVATARALMPRLWGLLAQSLSIVAWVVTAFMVLMYLFFILLDYETLEDGWAKAVPRRYRPFATGLADDLRRGMSRYFRGQSVVALAVGILSAIGFVIIDFPLGIGMGLLIGVLTLVPYLKLIALPAAALQHVVGRAGRLVAEPLAEVSAGERLAADAVAEDLLAVAGHALDDRVPADAHAVGGDRAGRAGPEVAGMAPIVPVRTELRARLVAHRRLRPAPHRRRDHLLPAGARDRLHAHVAAGDAGAGVAGQVAGVLPAVEQLPADARTDVEGPVGALAAVRAAERLAAVPPAVQLGLADALADERRAQRLLLLGRDAQRRGGVVQRPAGDRALGEAAAAGLRAGRLAGGAGARVALPRTGVQAAGQRLAADLAAAREGVRAAGPGRIDLQREVLAAGTARRGRDRVGTGTAVERVAELIAAVALALQHLPAHLAAAVAADPRFAHRQQSERLHARRRRVRSGFHVSLILRLLILLLSFFVFSLVFVLFFIAEIAEIAEAVQIAQHVRVVQRRADGSLLRFFFSTQQSVSQNTLASSPRDWFCAYCTRMRFFSPRILVS